MPFLFPLSFIQALKRPLPSCQKCFINSFFFVFDFRWWDVKVQWVNSEVQKHPAEFALSFKRAHKTLNRVQVQYRSYKRINRWHTASIKCILAASTLQMISQHHPKAVMGPFFTDSFSLLHQDQHNRFILGKHRKQTRPTTRLNQTPASKSSNLSLCFLPYHAPHYFYFALFVLSPRLKVGRAAEELSGGRRLERSLWRFEDGLISLSSFHSLLLVHTAPPPQEIKLLSGYIKR